MFAREADMTKPAADWLKAGGMLVKTEFASPWGLCDLVGVTFNSESVARRVRLKQTRAIGSITRAALLLSIPDAETGKWTTLDGLVVGQGTSIPREIIPLEARRLIADRFVMCSEDGRLQKLNGWMPLHDRLVAVELKRSKIEEAMRQALSNLGFAEESYVGLPLDVAERVASKPDRWSEYFAEGVGLLAVAPDSCRVLILPRKNQGWTNLAVQMHCVDKFWNQRTKSN